MGVGGWPMRMPGTQRSATKGRVGCVPLRDACLLGSPRRRYGLDNPFRAPHPDPALGRAVAPQHGVRSDSRSMEQACLTAPQAAGTWACWRLDLHARGSSTRVWRFLGPGARSAGPFLESHGRSPCCSSGIPPSKGRTGSWSQVRGQGMRAWVGDLRSHKFRAAMQDRRTWNATSRKWFPDG